MIVFDEYGLPVAVEAGDPARPYTNLLTGKGYRTIILPRGILCGIMEPANCTYEVPEDIIAAVRLEECVEVIK